MWQASPRYPDPAIEILDGRFQPYVLNSAAVERLFMAASQSIDALYLNIEGISPC